MARSTRCRVGAATASAWRCTRETVAIDTPARSATWSVTSAPTRGLFVALAAWTKFAALLLLPLWASYPHWRGFGRQKLTYLGGLLLGTALSFWILLLEPNPLHAAHVFWDRTFGWQLSRSSPFSIWDWDQYPGFPDLHRLQTVVKVAVLLGAVVVYFLPRRKNVIQLGALTAALIALLDTWVATWIAALYGPLHGGANQAAMEMFLFAQEHGRWLLTLYLNTHHNHAFVHALDLPLRTRRAVRTRLLFVDTPPIAR